MKFVFGYRTELFMIFLVPIRTIQWYRFLRYSGTGSSAMMVPIRALRWYRLTDTIKKSLVTKDFTTVCGKALEYYFMEPILFECCLLLHPSLSHSLKLCLQFLSFLPVLVYNVFLFLTVF